MKKKFVVRIYGPKDPFHKRSSFFDHRNTGDWFLQVAVGEWAAMIGVAYYSDKYPMNHLEIVNRNVRD